MGVNVSKTSVAPVAAQISVQPFNESSKLNSSGASSSHNTSLDHSLHMSPHSPARTSSEDTLKKSTSRPNSSADRATSSSGTRIRSGVRHQGSAVRRFTHHGLVGTHSRPISTISNRQRSGKEHPKRRDTLPGSPAGGLPLQRDLQLDLSSSVRIQRRQSIVQDFDSDVIVLKADLDQTGEKPASCCQLCGNQFTNLGIRVPLLLLCGHSYCSKCLEKACESCLYPEALKCGICSVITPLDQQTPDNLPQNEAILELIGSKEYVQVLNEGTNDKCAECEHKMATMYCSECNASYCDYCGKTAHEGSKVRSKHKPVPINLKPKPQPTCKKHPGQSCVLYCETEKQPMCVLCKFYNQHRFHKFDLMSKVAAKYCSSASENLDKLDKIEKDLDSAAKAMFNLVQEINSNARKAQERLERHFNEMRKSYLTALERREAILLTLLDKQVEAKQEMLAEMRMEVAAARARVLAAKEEGTVLLRLNPLTALLSRKHMDRNFERSLNETSQAPHCTMQPEVPLSLLPDITSSMVDTLHQHGAVLQLPPRPHIQTAQVKAKAISLVWAVQEEVYVVSSDRTLTYSLHCHADVPFKAKVKLNFKKQYVRKMVTPESGFEELSELSSESKNTFPSLPPSLLGSRNISLIRLQGKSSDGSESKDMEDETGESLVLNPTPGNITTLLPEPIRLPKVADDAQRPQLPNTNKRPTTQQEMDHPGAVFNLPPLVMNKPSTAPSETELLSVATSGGIISDSEETSGNSQSSAGRMSTVGENEESRMPKMSRTDSSTTFSDLDTSEDLNHEEYVNVGRFCHGYAFEEIYNGDKTSFHYSGLVPGATYYFRVRCHNAAGWGPWSDTVKCMTN